MSATDQILCATTPNAKPKRTDNAATKLEPLLPRLPIEPFGKFGAVIVRAYDRANDSPQNKPKHAPPCNRAYQLKMTQCRQWRRHFFSVQFQVFFCLIFSLKCRYLHERRERAKTKRENKQSVECDYSRKESNFVCYCLVFSTSVHFCSSAKSKKRLCISII